MTPERANHTRHAHLRYAESLRPLLPAASRRHPETRLRRAGTDRLPSLSFRRSRRTEFRLAGKRGTKKQDKSSLPAPARGASLCGTEKTIYVPPADGESSASRPRVGRITEHKQIRPAFSVIPMPISRPRFCPRPAANANRSDRQSSGASQSWKVWREASAIATVSRQRSS